MKKAMAFGTAGAVLVIALALNGSAASETGIPAIKTGLWEIEWHTNVAMFVVRNDQKPPEERARVSAQGLKHSLYKSACVAQAGALQPDAIVLHYDGCKLKSRPAGNGVATREGACSGRGDGISQMRVAVTVKSPEAAIIDLDATLDPHAGYPLIESYTMRWVSADCGDLPPGAVHPVPAPRRGD